MCIYFRTVCNLCIIVNFKRLLLFCNPRKRWQESPGDKRSFFRQTPFTLLDSWSEYYYTTHSPKGPPFPQRLDDLPCLVGSSEDLTRLYRWVIYVHSLRPVSVRRRDVSHGYDSELGRLPWKTSTLLCEDFTVFTFLSPGWRCTSTRLLGEEVV